ncbi:hypothetical protein VPH35_123147 [Triticum aestivum]
MQLSLLPDLAVEPNPLGHRSTMAPSLPPSLCREPSSSPQRRRGSRPASSTALEHTAPAFFHRAGGSSAFHQLASTPPVHHDHPFHRHPPPSTPTSSPVAHPSSPQPQAIPFHHRYRITTNHRLPIPPASTCSCRRSRPAAGRVPRCDPCHFPPDFPLRQ